MRNWIIALAGFAVLLLTTGTTAEENRLLKFVPPEASVTANGDIPVVRFGEGIELRRFWGESILMSQTRLAKGAKSPHHNHSEEEIIVVISGRLRATAGDMEFIVEPGGYFHVPSYVLHQIEALEDTFIVEAFGPGRMHTQTEGER